MVAGPEPQRTDSYDALVQRIARLEQALDETGRASKFPLIVSHAGVADFQIVPSVSGDGSADIQLGNGVGGKLMQIITDPLYGTKIFKLLDQQGASMMSTDALSGYGWGTPSYPYVYNGYSWDTVLSGATSHGTAKEFGRGANYVYNPATYVNPIIRVTSATAETIKVFAQWKDAQSNLNDTAEQTITVTAGGTTTSTTTPFAKNWDANDMNGPTFLFIKAYVVGGTPGNVHIGMSFSEGYGVSQRFYNDNVSTWAV